MGYLVAAIVVLVLVTAFVTFFVLNATRRSGSAGPQDPGAEGSPAGIAAPDETPLGTTSEHSEATGQEGKGPDAPDSTQEGEGGPGVPESERLANRPR
jgi:hypothetical protein